MVHHESGHLKAGSNVSPLGCCDAVKVRRGGADAKQPTCISTCNVIKCERTHCMTCKHLVLGSSFSSNVTNNNTIM